MTCENNPETNNLTESDMVAQLSGEWHTFGGTVWLSRHDETLTVFPEFRFSD
jgi:hypothetical protein